MTTVRRTYRDAVPAEVRGGAVAVGNFDGVHRGHVQLLRTLAANARGSPVVIVTFDPHPLQLLRPQQFQPLLTTLPRRSELLHARGVDHVIVLETTPELLALEADEFFAQVLHEQLKASVVVEGPDFRFGRDRRGDVARLRQLCRESGMHFATAAAVRCERGEVISSSRVRTALEAGEVEAAERLLDRPYGLTGRVVVGQRRGRSLGFPTANLDAIETVVPKDGVYAVRVHLSDACFAGAAHVGPRPTFGENQKSVEVHLIDFEGNLYDRELEVDFLHRLRDTQFFPEPHALAAQLRADVEQARRLASPGSS